MRLNVKSNVSYDWDTINAKMMKNREIINDFIILIKIHILFLYNINNKKKYEKIWNIGF